MGLESFEKASIFFEMPNASYSGLWFPYTSELGLADSGVPDIIKRRFKDTLGDTPEHIHSTFESLSSSWGTIKHTEFGKIVTHLLVVIDIAIECQASVRIRGDKGTYEGAVLIGAKYTVHIQGRLYEPGNSEKLNDAINSFGNNEMLLKKIANELSGADMNMFSTVKSFNELRALVQDCATSDADTEGLTVIARQLSFPERPFWKPSLENIIFMLKCLDPNKTSMEELLSYGPDQLPMGPDALFTGERERLVLSCFGSEVPSFVIPYGGKMTLEGDFGKNVQTPGRKGGSSGSTFKTCQEVSVRFVPLKIALSDIAKVKEEKAIYNPFAVPKAKRSAGNQYKTFTGEGARKLVAALKEFVNVMPNVASGSKKRQADNVQGEGSNKRQAISWDF